MTWRKKGVVYAPSGTPAWAQTHAHLPTPLLIGDATIRVYFAALDTQQFGRATFVDVRAENPSEIIRAVDTMSLDLGDLGSFDDSGVVPSCALRVDGEVWLYYVGFQRSSRVPYMLFSGLAKSSDGVHFERHARVPVLDRTAEEPFSRGAPYVLREGNVWKMWYWSCTEWTETGGRVHYNNVIRYATSSDGVHWSTHPHVCVAPANDDEFAIGRPCVVDDAAGYRMWYSIRMHPAGYVIGYAESADGIHWTRRDELAGIVPSESGWDSEMICYPAVIRTRWGTYLFYNGNSHGRTGFGYAVLESDR
jgi:hypothetical protein